MTTVELELRISNSAVLRARLAVGSFKLMFVLNVRGCNVITPDPDCTGWTIFMSSAVKVIAPFPADVSIPLKPSTVVIFNGAATLATLSVNEKPPLLTIPARLETLFPLPSNETAPVPARIAKEVTDIPELPPTSATPAPVHRLKVGTVVGNVRAWLTVIWPEAKASLRPI
jgi:hypothetical protein